MQDSRRKEIRNKADLFRRKCGVKRYGIIDLFEVCLQEEYKLLRYPLGEGADLGFVIKKDDDIVIFTNSCSRLSREIFTLAHEIGHVILHLDTGSTFIDNTITLSERSMDEREQEANFFAACLLMPEDSVKKFIEFQIQTSSEKEMSALDIARIMSEFGVSFDMTLNQLQNLNIINQKQRTCLDNEKTETRVGNLLRSVGGNARLNVPSNEIDIPPEYIDYTIYNYNHNAIPKETLVKVLSCYQLSIEDVRDKITNHLSDSEDDLEELIEELDD